MAKTSSLAAIRLRGVRHNNLKNFDLDLPLNRLIVITGLSGSGKSSLAFDTLFAEGQRRYVETFSPYARQFFDRMDKPQVDSIEGIPPAIAIEQRNTVRTTRSTVGTMTEVCDYMKVLWAHLAQLHCRRCGAAVRKDPPQAIWAQVRAAHAGQEALITFELPLTAKLSLQDSLALIARQGYQRLRVRGEVIRLEEAVERLREPPPTALTVVQDRLPLTESHRARFVDACEQAYHFGKARLSVHTEQAELAFSNRLHCAPCDLEHRPPSAALFSFNHPLGACPSCRGFGRTITIDYDAAMPDRNRTLAEGVVKPWLSGMSAECQDDLMTFCRKRGVPTRTPFNRLEPRWQRWVVDGDPGYGKDAQHRWPRAWYGVKGYFRWLESKAYKMHVRVLLARYRAYQPCLACDGQRFQPEALLFRVTLPNPVRGSSGPEAGLPPGAVTASLAGAEPNARAPLEPASTTLADFYRMPVEAALGFIQRVSALRRFPAHDPVGLALGEVRSRLGYLVEVGLGYLSLDRPTRTLSGGETERVNLTACLGTRLVSTLFVLDEPSVGLHARDTARLVCILHRLRDLGNTVVVVEHEAAIIQAADQIVDLGPGHGQTGGEVVFQGTLPRLLRCKVSLTGQYLAGHRPRADARQRPVALAATAGQLARSLVIAQATRHNLRDLTVAIPLGRFVCVTGVSGSGKSTLLREVLWPALQTALHRAPAVAPGTPDSASPANQSTDAEADQEEEQAPAAAAQPAAALSGWEFLAGAVLVDQSPLGKTPRSNPAVYLGAFDAVRELFALAEPARQQGLGASAFSFNSKAGQCERCRGAGFERVEMQFLSDVFIRCPACEGRRYRAHILQVTLSPPGLRAPPVGARKPSHTSVPLAWSIADLLAATVEEATAFLRGFGDAGPAGRAVARLDWLARVGLGYLRLGQPLNTLSGGECQRLKLASHLAEAGAAQRPGRRGPTSQPAEPKPLLFLFDEPTTGLHFDDVRVLVGVLQELVDAGHSVVVIEHNLDVIRSADWVIDLGPEAGEAGGRLVAQGSPEQIAACPASHTGAALRGALAAAHALDGRAHPA